MKQTRVWKNGDQWRTLAYTYYRDSRSYRYILELNPSFDIRTIPAPGVTVNVSGELGPGKYQPRQVGASGMLKQVDINLDLRVGPEVTPTSLKNSIFPYQSFALYSDRIGQYTAASLLAPDRTNGYTLDSPQATGETQRG